MSAENRRFTRVPTNRIGQAAIMRVDGLSLQCDIVNESSGGYGVITPPANAALFLPGRILTLEMSDLTVKVKVAHAKAEDSLFKIGLERITEDDNEVNETERCTWLAMLKGKATRSPEADSTMVRDLAIAALLAASLLIALILPTAMAQTQGKKVRATATESTASTSKAKRISAAQRK